jgi:hypothetical protein
MNLLQFDLAELNINRSGRLSDRQKERLQIKESGAKAGSLFLGGIFMLSSLAGAGLGVYALMIDYGLVFRILMVSIFGCFWTLIWGAAGAMTLSRAFAKMEVKVGRAEGPINIVKVVRREYNSSAETYSDYSVHELLVGGRAFEVRSILPEVMKQGDVYAVYFAEFNLKEKKKEVLSAEWLAPASAATAAQAASHDDIEVVEFIKKGDVLRAIRAHRQLHGTSYEDARTAVLDIQARH